MYNTISDDLNWGIHEEYTRNGYYMDGAYHTYSNGYDVYGAFPAEYSDGNAAIIRTLGPEISTWYRMQALGR